MSTHPTLQDALVQQLSAMNYPQTCAWLQQALRGAVPLPRIAPDEHRHLGVLRLEGLLDKPTRRDLEDACRQLVYEFARTLDSDEEYVSALLHVAVGLRIHEVVPGLVSLARSFTARPNTPANIRRLVLEAIVDLRAAQPMEFWVAMRDLDPPRLAVLSLSGMLRTHKDAALLELARLPLLQPVADAAAVLLEQTANRLPTDERPAFLSQVRQAATRCQPLLRQPIQEWLEEIGEWTTTKRRDYSNLDLGLRGKHLPHRPCSARL